MAGFEYGDEALAHLSKRDRKFAALIERMGRLERELTPDLFAALTGGIIAQQISGKAAVTVENRLLDKVKRITPESVAALSPEEIQSCGMSMKKARNILSAAEAVLAGTLPIGRFPEMSDAEVVEQLSALPGIGVWTAEMLLIFSLGRQDVLSYGDFGIRQGIMRLYGHKVLPRERFLRYRKRYSPYGSIAAFYLWELAGE